MVPHIPSVDAKGELKKEPSEKQVPEKETPRSEAPTLASSVKPEPDPVQISEQKVAEADAD